MPHDPLVIDALADVLEQAVSRHGGVVDSGAVWLQPDEVVSDHLGCHFTAAAALHPGNARDGARDLLDRLAAHGLSIQRVTARDGNSLATRLLRLSTALIMAGGDPARVQGIADAMCALAAEAKDRDDAVIPPHLRMVPGDMPAGVVRLDDCRRARA